MMQRSSNANAQLSGLEPRRLFSVQTLLKVEGLPRELTAVGDTVYFARDSGKDGHLSFPRRAASSCRAITRIS